MTGAVLHSVHASASLPVHHPDQALLLDYASGALAETSALVIASHLAWCPDCREVICRLERVGGELLDQAPQEPVSMSCFSRVMARLDEEPVETLPVLNLRELRAESGPGGRLDRSNGGGHNGGGNNGTGVRSGDAGLDVPQPLRSYLLSLTGADAGASLNALPWQRRMRGLDEIELAPQPGRPNAPRIKLVRIRAGHAAPRHTHTGTELTVVLAGGFHDEFGRYRRGDVLYHDATVDHQPVADPGEDCLCLSVLDAPLRLTGPLGRMLNPFLRF